MPQADSIFWVAAVAVVIWAGVFFYCLHLDRKVRELEEHE